MDEYLVEVKSFVRSDKNLITVEPDMTEIQFCFKLLKNEIETKKKECAELENSLIKRTTEMQMLNEELLKKDKEISMLKTIIDRIPEQPVPLNTWNGKSFTYSSEECTSALQVPNLDLPVDLPETSSLLSPNKYKYPNDEEEKKLFETFIELPEISEDLNFYKQSLETNFKKAQLLAQTIEHCQREIIQIKQQLDTFLSWNERNNLLPKLEEQQALYKKTLIELRSIQNETVHLQCGLRKAEVRSQHKFRTWIQEYMNNKKTFQKQYDEKKSHKNTCDKIYYKDDTAASDQGYTHSKKVNENIADYNSIGDNKVSQDAKYNSMYKDKQLSSNNEGVLQKFPITNVAYYFQNPYYEHNSNIDSSSSTACAAADPVMLDKSSGNSSQHIHCCQQFRSDSTIPPPKTPNALGKSVDSLPDDLVATKESNSIHTLVSSDEMLEKIVSKESSASIVTLTKECSISTETCLSGVSQIPHKDEEPQLKDDAIEPAERDQLYMEQYFLPTDTMEFKIFMKTVNLTGQREIDEEIFNFYRSKFC